MKQTENVVAQPLSTAEAKRGRAPVILRSTDAGQSESWQQQWSSAYTSTAQLCQALQLNPDSLPISNPQQFGLRVPKSFVAKMRCNDPSDPLLLQVLPSKQEQQQTASFNKDPLSEANYNPAPGIIHKYHGRALITVTGSCAVHCRYCFRRHYPYQQNNSSHWSQTLAYLQQHQDIGEVILSGGDPLALNDKHLRRLINDLAQIEHLHTLRIHSRFPIMIAQRLTDELLQGLQFWQQHKGPCVLVLHSNHSAELDQVLAEHLRPYQQAGVRLFNQAVLLKGVNDSAATLIDLQHKLFGYQIQPYYLHLLDSVQGAAHFEVDEISALALYQQMQNQLPGYLVPKLVRDIPGKAAKTVLQV